jgi:transcriptional regulator with XRE-family HTH domain
LAARVGAKYYTTISRIENGRLGVAPDRYLAWAQALGVNPRWFVQKLMSYYDPVTYEILFASREQARQLCAATRSVSDPAVDVSRGGMRQGLSERQGEGVPCSDAPRSMEMGMIASPRRYDDPLELKSDVS